MKSHTTVGFMDKRPSIRHGRVEVFGENKKNSNMIGSWLGRAGLMRFERTLLADKINWE
jgi:hypothetical protein